MQGHTRSRPMSAAYTYDLPYAVRRNVCNLLDADQSWRTLGGQSLGLNSTQLTLMGQAYLRNSSPAEELFNKFDSFKMHISDLYLQLKQMGHYRALEVLEPFVFSAQAQAAHQDVPMMSNFINAITLNTPTPSFAELGRQQLPNAITFGSNNYDWALSQQTQRDDNFPQAQQPPAVAEQRCCKASERTTEPSEPPVNWLADDQLPLNHGEELVRKACSSNRKRTDMTDEEVANQLRLSMQINYEELKQASNNFSEGNIVGNGGFASVYNGCWKGTDVAIKRLKYNLMHQALNELTIMNGYKIDNILPIYGISINGPEACLVYQFMVNGSLEDRLLCKNGSRPLTWDQRALIGEGVAKGLYYLHTVRKKPLVHGDVKSANVLLDAQMVPKLGDFGLARQVLKSKNQQTEFATSCTVSSIHGTSVYLPPEYLRHKILSPAVDVYSYGIVLLEMGTGRRAYDGKRLLIDYVNDEMDSTPEGQISYSLKDPKLVNETEIELKIWYELLILLGQKCAHKIKNKRPDMGQILERFASFRQSALSRHSSSESTFVNSFPKSNGNSMRTLSPDLEDRGRAVPEVVVAPSEEASKMMVEQEVLRELTVQVGGGARLQETGADVKRTPIANNNNKNAAQTRATDNGTVDKVLIPLISEFEIFQRND